MLEDQVEALIALPRSKQLEAWRKFLASSEAPAEDEAWNTAFGAGSLFEAWTSTSIAMAIYEANRIAIRDAVWGKSNVRIVEIGAGNGTLWTRLPDLEGELVVVDPVANALDTLRACAPKGLRVTQLHGAVEDVELPEADVLVCSLTLHHVAGRDAAERASHGLSGEGKLEILERFRECIRPRGGVGLLNEADVHCDLSLAPGEPELVDNLFDSYVRRCARSICADLRERTDDPDLAARWRVMLYRWFLEQPKLATVPLAERDVYELSVGRWLDVLGAAGLSVDPHHFTDDVGLFVQYRFR